MIVSEGVLLMELYIIMKAWTLLPAFNLMEHDFN